MFLGKTVNFHSVSLVIQEHKWVLAKCQNVMMKCWGLVSGPWGSGDALSYLARVQS